jgi:hypothetical protein
MITRLMKMELDAELASMDERMRSTINEQKQKISDYRQQLQSLRTKAKK